MKNEVHFMTILKIVRKSKIYSTIL